MDKDELLWVALDVLFPKKKDIINILDLPKSGKYTNEDKRQSIIKIRDWLIKYDLYIPNNSSKPDIELRWPEDPKQFNWPAFDKIIIQPPVKTGKNVAILAHLLIIQPETLERSLSRNKFNPRKREHLWIMGLINMLNGTNSPQKISLFYSLRTKAGIVLGWQRLKHNLENSRLDIWDLIFVTSILSQYHHKRDPSEARANQGRIASRGETPRPISDLEDLTLSAASIKNIIAWLSNLKTSSDPNKLENIMNIVKGLFESFLLQTHLKPHISNKRTPADIKKERRDNAINDLATAENLVFFAKDHFPDLDMRPILAKIDNMRRHARGSKEEPSEVEKELKCTHPHFEVFYYLHEAHRGEQSDKWSEWLDRAYTLLEQDAQGLVMYGPLLDVRARQLKEALP